MGTKRSFIVGFEKRAMSSGAVKVMGTALALASMAAPFYSTPIGMIAGMEEGEGVVKGVLKGGLKGLVAGAASFPSYAGGSYLGHTIGKKFLKKDRNRLLAAVIGGGAGSVLGPYLVYKGLKTKKDE